MKKIDENGNIIIYNDEKQLENCSITFNSKNCICYIKDATLNNVNIYFSGDNSLLFLGKSKLEKVNLNLCTKSVIYIGDYIYFNPGGIQTFSTHERNNIFIGDKTFLSTSLEVLTSDAHLIYDIKSKIRINQSKSVFIGDYVWIGEGVKITKGAMISSGSIVGTRSLVTSIIPPNCAIGGVSAKVLKNNVFWTGQCVFRWEAENSKKAARCDNAENFIFNNLKNKGINLALQTDLNLKKAKSAQERLEILQKFHANKDKRRFVFSKNDQIFMSSAVDIVHKHLSYKLGRAMIENYKSVFGWIKMPFVLLKIMKNHNSKTLPNLKLLPDYDLAQKVQNEITYKLGQALIKSWKNWYKGGFIKFIYEIKSLKKEWNSKNS